MTSTNQTPAARPRGTGARFAAVMSTGPASKPVATDLRAETHDTGVLDECDFVEVFRFQFPALADAVDRERREQMHSATLDGYRATWRLATIVQRVFETRTGEGPLLAWAEKTDDRFWHELGFWRRPTSS